MANPYADLIPKTAKPAADDNPYADLVPRRAEDPDFVLGEIEKDVGVKFTPAQRKQYRAEIEAGDFHFTAAKHEKPASPKPVLGEAAPPKAKRVVPDYSKNFGTNDGGLDEIVMRAVVGRVPDLIANLIELPATANEAAIRVLGDEPSQTGFFAGARKMLRKGAAVARDISFTKEFDEEGYGVPSVSGADVVESLNPNANKNRAAAAAGFGEPGNYAPLTLGDRISNVATFVPETLVASLPDMIASLNPATLAALVGSRTNEVGRNRATNDKRENVSATDLAIAAPAAAFEALLERFTTMRLLPAGTTAATPGAAAAVARIAKELGIQSTLGGVEEVAPYLAETAGTELGATAGGAIESFVGGALAEGALGGAAQSVKEVARAVSPNPYMPAAPLGEPPPSVPPAATARPSLPPATPVPAGQTSDADLDALLLRNLPEIVEAIGPEGVQAVLGEALAAEAPAADPVAAPEAAPAPEPAQELGGPIPDIVAQAAAELGADPRAPAAPPATPNFGAQLAQARAATQSAAYADAPPAVPVARVAPASDGGSVVPPRPEYSPPPGVPLPANETARDLLPEIRKELGWAQKGGGIIRGEEKPNDGMLAPVIGRTPWIAKMGMDGEESVTWSTRPDQSLTLAQANKALDKFDAGQKLGPREQAFVEHALRAAQSYLDEMTVSRELDRQAAMQSELHATLSAIDPADHADALTFAGLLEQAYAAGVDSMDIMGATFESTMADQARRLIELTQGARNAAYARPDESNRPLGEDRQGRGPASDAAEVAAPARQEAAPPRLELGAPAAEPAAPAPRPSPAADLFPKATPREKVAAAARAKDDQRDGKTATTPTPGASGLPLFAGKAPEQAKIPEKQVTWREALAKAKDDLYVQKDILERVSNMKSTPEEQAEVLALLSPEFPDAARIAYNVSANAASSPETKAAALALREAIMAPGSDFEAPGAEPFDSEKFNREREDRVDASRTAGNVHLDKVPPSFRPTGVATQVVVVDRGPDTPQFSRRRSGSPLAQVELSAIADRVVAGANRPKVLVRTFDALPDDIKQAAEDQGAAPEEIRAVYHRGFLYLVEGHLYNSQEAEQALFHEYYGHYGLRAKFGNALGSKLDQVLAGVGGIEGVLRLAKKQGIRLDDYAAGVLGNPKYSEAEQHRTLAEELLAHMAEATGSLRTIFNEVVGAVRAFLRARGFPSLAELGVTDLAALLKEAREAAVASETSAGGPRFQRVFHGTPHRGIEQTGFSLQKIGTGEGQQAYGWGLYFAGKREIAEYYRESLSKTKERFYLDGSLAFERELNGAALDISDPKTAAIFYIGNEGYATARSQVASNFVGKWAESVLAEIDKLKGRTIRKESDPAGQLYHAEVPEDSDLLDHNLDFLQQPKGVQEKLRPIMEDIIKNAEWGVSLRAEDGGRVSAASGIFIHTADTNAEAKAGARRKRAEHMSGWQIYDYLVEKKRAETRGTVRPIGGRVESAEQFASHALYQVGIPGLRYLDNSSRNQTPANVAKYRAKVERLRAEFTANPTETNKNRLSDSEQELQSELRKERELTTYNYVIWDEAAISDVQPMFSRRPVTPAQKTALEKAGLAVDERSRLDKVRDWLTEETGKLRDMLQDPDSRRQALVDRFHGLRAAELRAGGVLPVESPYLAARNTTGLASVMEAVLRYGAPQWRDGVLNFKPNTKGLLDALKPVEGSIDDWLGWMVGRRAKALKAQGRENLLDDTDIDALLALANGREAEFKQAATDYLQLKAAILDVAEEAGIIDPVGRATWDQAEYIPFYREEDGDTIGPGTRKGLEGQTSGIKTLKGGKQNLHDPLSNIVRNYTKLIDASMKNHAVLLAVDKLPGEFDPAPMQMTPALIPLDQVKKHLLAQGVPQAAIDAMPASAVKGVQRMLSISAPTAEDVVRVMRAGKAEYKKVKDPLLLRALTAFKANDKNPVIKPFIFAKRLLTVGVTVTPEFVGANFLRDSGAAWVMADDRFIPIWDSVKGAVNTLRKDPATLEMMMAGSSFMGGQYYGGDADSAAAALRRSLRAKGMGSADIEGFIGTIARTPLKLWDSWMTLSSAMENANRNAVYSQAIKAGRSHAEAAFMAKDLMDFSMQGDSKFIQFFGDVLPFFNARLQGAYKLGRQAVKPSTRRRMAARGSMIALASVGLLAWNLAMYRDAYDELEEWDKDTYWHIAPGTPYHVRIPKPFEIGLVFGTIPERMAMAAMRIDNAKQSFGAMFRAIAGTMAINPIPQGALPLVEEWANKRFFTGRAIENQGDDKLLPEAREEWFTSDTMKFIAEHVGNSTGLSAKRLEHLWNGYMGGMGAYLLDTSDWILRQATDAPERPAMALKDFPVVGRFLRGGNPPTATRFQTEFYDKLGKAEEVEGTIKDYLAKAEAGDPGAMAEAIELREKHRDLLGEVELSKNAKHGFGYSNVKAMREIQQQLGKLRHDSDAVAQDRKLSADEKRDQLDKLTAQRNRLTRDATKGRVDALATGPGEMAQYADMAIPMDGSPMPQVKRLTAAEEMEMIRKGVTTSKAGKAFKRAEDSLRATFRAKGEEAALAELEEKRELFGEEVTAEVVYDDDGKGKLVIHGLKARRDALSEQASAKTPPPQ